MSGYSQLLAQPLYGWSLALVCLLSLPLGWMISVLSRGIPLSLEEDWEEEKTGVSKERGRFASLTFVRWFSSGGMSLREDAVFAFVLAALVFAASLSKIGLVFLPFLALLVLLAKIDFETFLLPDVLTIPLLWIGLLVSAFLYGDIRVSLAGATIGYLSLWLLTWGFFLATGKVGMGGGDFKLLAAIGAWTGPFPLIVVLLLASFSGLAFAVVKKLSSRAPLGRQPFGPFLAIGGIVWILLGKWIVETFF